MSNRIRTGLALACCLVFSWAGSGSGASVSGPWGVDELMRQLGGVDVSEASFVEQRNLSVLTEPLVLRGRLVYRSPAYMRKEVLHPYREIYEIDDDVLTIETHQGDRHVMILDDYPVLEIFSEAFRATLAGDRKILEAHYRLELAGEHDGWTLQLRPRNWEARQYVSTILIHGREAEVASIDIHEVGGDFSTMVIQRDGER